MVYPKTCQLPALFVIQSSLGGFHVLESRLRWVGISRVWGDEGEGLGGGGLERENWVEKKGLRGWENV